MAIGGFIGSFGFIYAHLLLFGGWILANTVGLPGVPMFDPELVLVATFAAIEAIFLTTLVLINQNRMSAVVERAGRARSADQPFNRARSDANASSRQRDGGAPEGAFGRWTRRSRSSNTTSKPPTCSTRSSNADGGEGEMSDAITRVTDTRH